MFLAIPTKVHDGKSASRVTVANSLIIAITVLAWFLGLRQPVGPGTGFFSVLGYGFSHAGLAHLMVNMWLLWVIGNPVNRRVGDGYYLLGYLGTIISMGICAKFMTGAYLVGSSGAIFAVIAVLAMLLPSSKTEVNYVAIFPLTLLLGLINPPRASIHWFIRCDSIRVPSWYFLFLVPVMQIMGLFWWSWNWTNLGHLAGFFCGVVFVLLLPASISLGRSSRSDFRFQS